MRTVPSERTRSTRLPSQRFLLGTVVIPAFGDWVCCVCGTVRLWRVGEEE
jgi:hypothetical protein